MTDETRDRDLTRSVPFVFVRDDEHGDGRTLAGYAAVFDTPTEIDSYEGRFTETIARGAFRKTISERTPVLMYNHGRHVQVGDLPIGKITELREDDRGLYVEARLFDNNVVEPVRQAIEAGAINGMSFRFGVVKDRWNKDKSERVLQELKLAELGPVNFPAYAETTVGVRSLDVPVGTVKLHGDGGPNTTDIEIDVLARALIEQPEALRALSARILSHEPAPATRDDTAALEAASGEQSTSEPLEEQPASVTAPTSKRERIETLARLKGMLPNGN